jgi:hypothetical protein
MQSKSIWGLVIECRRFLDRMGENEKVVSWLYQDKNEGKGPNDRQER